MMIEKSVLVAVSVIVNLVYDSEPDAATLRSDAIDNFLDHPALQSKEELKAFDAQFVDDVRVVDTRVTEDGEQPCVCGGKGWLHVNIDGDPARPAIERCDACFKFATDDEAIAAYHVSRVQEANECPRR